MARPLRIEFDGALYHVTSRGDGRKDIYLDDNDRSIYLEILADVQKRFNWAIHAYCLMSNHYHLLIETPDSNLARGMRHLNGVYTQRFNYHHKRVGHVFQGRYKAILVQKESYLLELSRYIVLNPVRARMVRVAKEWKWSSYRSTAGFIDREKWLTTDWVLSAFSQRKIEAMQQYRTFVSQGLRRPKPWEDLKNQIYLGDEEFVDEMLGKVSVNMDLSEIPSSQKRRIAKPLEFYERKNSDRNMAIAKSYESGAYSLKVIGEYYNLHYSTVSRIVKAKGKT